MTSWRPSGALVAGMLVTSVSLGLGACSELPPLEEGVCGNGVVDQGEQCDLVALLGEQTSCGMPGSGVAACQYVCDEEAKCPAAWGCGTDGICRFASGAFEEVPLQPWVLHDDLRLVDLDGDGHLDIVGSTRNRAWIRLGDGRGGFSAPKEHWPGISDVPRLRDIDGDGATDMVGPGGGGVVLVRGQPGGEVAPVPLWSLGLDASFDAWLPFPVGSPDSQYSYLLVLAEEGDQLLLVPVDDNGRVGGDRVAVSTNLLLDHLAGRIPSGLGEDGNAEFALAFEGEQDVYLYRVTSGQPLVIEPLEPIGLESPVAEGGAMFGDQDGDGLTDMLIVDIGASAPFTVDMPTRNPLPRSQACSDLDWPLAFGDLNEDGAPDLVAPGGIVLLGGDTCTPVAGPPSPWAAAVIADFNRDGHHDVAAVSADTDYVDVLLGPAGSGLTRFPIGTRIRVADLRAGDFDGDRVTDLAVTAEPADGRSGRALSVFFGRVDGEPLSAPVEMARFDDVASLEPLLLNLFGTGDGVVDLLVQPSLTEPMMFMVGTTERSLVSPFIIGSGVQVRQPSLVLPGRFDPSDAIMHLLAFTSEDVHLLRAIADGGVRIEERTQRILYEAIEPALADLGGVGCSGSELVVDLDADGRDEVLVFSGTALEGFDRECQPASAPLAVFRIKPSQDFWVESDLLDLGGTPTDLRVALAASLDTGGEPDLVLASAHVIWIYWNDQTGLDVSDPSTATFEAGIRDIAVANVDDDAERELAIATDAGVVVIDVDPRGTLRSGPEPAVARAGAWIEAGDLNGDGVEDLVLSDGASVEVLLAVPGGLRDRGEGAH